MRPVGWRYDSYRHSLAAKGVKTGRVYVVQRTVRPLSEERHGYFSSGVFRVADQYVRDDGSGNMLSSAKTKLANLHEAGQTAESNEYVRKLEKWIEENELSPEEKAEKKYFHGPMEYTAKKKITREQLERDREENEKFKDAPEEVGPFVLVDVKRKVFDPTVYPDFDSAVRANLIVQAMAGNDFVVPLNQERRKGMRLKPGRVDVYQSIDDEYELEE